MENWKEKVKFVQEGVFNDELRFGLNKLLEVPVEKQPSEKEIMEFILESLKKDFESVFVNWNKFENNKLSKEYEIIKKKAENYDLIEKKVFSIYQGFDDNDNQIPPVEEGDIVTIGEFVCNHFGML